MIATNPWRRLQGSSGAASDLGLGAGPTEAPVNISRKGMAARDCPTAPAKSRAARGDGGSPSPGQVEIWLRCGPVPGQGRSVGSWRPALLLGLTGTGAASPGALTWGPGLWAG